jgi:hypothetical protein
MDLINSFKERVLKVNKVDFESLAIDVFRFQYLNNPVYKSYINFLGINPDKIDQVTAIPFLPVSFFKSHKVSINNGKSPIIFSSSGTTGVSRSNHVLPDPEWYKIISQKGFEAVYGPLKDTVILALLPSYQQNPSSSLIFMVDHFIRETENESSGYYYDLKKLEAVRKNLPSGKKVILIGVSYALSDFAENGTDLSGWTIMETGGMKGRKRELVRNELHEILQNGFNISAVHSEYGMTELLSQAYSQAGGIFSTPPWMKVSCREVNDPFSDSNGRTGVLKVIDLANIYSCSFVETEDLGIIHADGRFEVLGRLDNTEVRGCNLLYTG